LSGVYRSSSAVRVRAIEVERPSSGFCDTGRSSSGQIDSGNGIVDGAYAIDIEGHIRIVQEHRATGSLSVAGTSTAGESRHHGIAGRSGVAEDCENATFLDKDRAPQAGTASAASDRGIARQEPAVAGTAGASRRGANTAASATKASVTAITCEPVGKWVIAAASAPAAESSSATIAAGGAILVSFAAAAATATEAAVSTVSASLP